jgi:hypothetical protein
LQAACIRSDNDARPPPFLTLHIDERDKVLIARRKHPIPLPFRVANIARMNTANAGTWRAVKTFDAQAMLTDLESAEGAIHDGSVIVTGSADDLLQDLYDTFVWPN